jgi:hypothetical protein
MGLNRIQKQFIRLSNIQRNRVSIPRRTRRKKMFGTGWASKAVKVHIINAITGETTVAKSYEESPAKLKKWLKLRNMRAQFSEMVIHKNSIWNQLRDADFVDFPVIIKVGTYQSPYVIVYVGDKITIGNKTTATLFLRTVDNIDYLSLIGEKRKIVENLPKPMKVTTVKKAKVKKVKRSKKLSYLDRYDSGWE